MKIKLKSANPDDIRVIQDVFKFYISRFEREVRQMSINMSSLREINRTPKYIIRVEARLHNEQKHSIREVQGDLVHAGCRAFNRLNRLLVRQQRLGNQ